jgi:3-phenylpropionate/trans-cinnamate dioxygenase ferredoxin subunit
MHSACPLAALAPGDAVRLDTSPPIAVFHTEDGELFALDDTCTHQDASLADGWVEGCEVELWSRNPMRRPTFHPA